MLAVAVEAERATPSADPPTSIEALAPGGGASRSRAQPVQGIVKRTLDIVVAAVVLLLALPLMAVIAVAIVVDSPGPVFYAAERVGRHGRPLRMLKFRKMRNDARGMRLTVGRDARFTRVGQMLARTKLDELPQLIHVLLGEMSLVGPRPEDAAFVAAHREDYAEILSIRPGITGPSQIAFAGESRILCSVDPVGHYLGQILPQKCALDRMYVRTAGLGTDLRILLWTSIAVVGRCDVAVHRDTGRLARRRRPPASTSPRDRLTPAGVRWV